MLRGSGGPVFSRHHNATTTMAVRSVTRSPGASWERRDETWRRLRVTRLRISYELRDRDRGKGAGCEERTAIHCSLFTIHYSLLPTLKFRQGKFTKNYSLFAIGYSLFTVYCSLFTVHCPPSHQPLPEIRQIPHEPAMQRPILEIVQPELQAEDHVGDLAVEADE